MIVENWHRIPYAEALERQQALFAEAIARRSGVSPLENTLILCEHNPVYTIGKHGKEDNMLLSKEMLTAKGLTLYHIQRGGDITYHGPGQIVGYPIFNLKSYGIGLKEYVWRLEEIIIQTIAEYGVQGERLHGATGVWIDPQTPRARKICAIGISASHFITMHGFALNINTDLQYFTFINPCGFVDKGVTSLAQELGREVPLQEVEDKIIHYFHAYFD